MIWHARHYGWAGGLFLGSRGVFYSAQPYADYGNYVARRLKEDDKLLLLDFGRAMAERLSGSDPCALFDDCHAHFNEAGYRMLAEIMAEFLWENGLARN